ncbi:unnamed protein product [Bathycoccus prasinos]
MASSLTFSASVSQTRLSLSKNASSKKRVSVQTKAASFEEACKANGCAALAAAVASEGLTAALSEGSFTVFAPNDAAMAAYSLPEGKALGDILKYHCIKGKIMSKHVTNFPLIMTLEGNKIAIDSKTFKTEGRIEVGMPPQGTQGLAGRVDGGFIGAVDIEFDNGIIHVIDGVATPKPPLIGQNGGYVAGTVPGSGEGRTGLDTKVYTK